MQDCGPETWCMEYKAHFETEHAIWYHDTLSCQIKNDVPAGVFLKSWLNRLNVCVLKGVHILCKALSTLVNTCVSHFLSTQGRTCIHLRQGFSTLHVWLLKIFWGLPFQMRIRKKKHDMAKKCRINRCCNAVSKKQTKLYPLPWLASGKWLSLGVMEAHKKFLWIWCCDNHRGLWLFKRGIYFELLSGNI